MHGGKRPGSGRKPDAGQPRAHRIDVRVSEAELAELLDAAGTEPLTTWLRTAGLAAARTGHR